MVNGLSLTKWFCRHHLFDSFCFNTFEGSSARMLRESQLFVGEFLFLTPRMLLVNLPTMLMP